MANVTYAMPRGNGKKKMAFSELHREAIQAGMEQYGEIMRVLGIEEQMDEWQRLMFYAYAGHKFGVPIPQWNL